MLQSIVNFRNMYYFVYINWYVFAILVLQCLTCAHCFSFKFNGSQPNHRTYIVSIKFICFWYCRLWWSEFIFIECLANNIISTMISQNTTFFFMYCVPSKFRKKAQTPNESWILVYSRIESLANANYREKKTFKTWIHKLRSVLIGTSFVLSFLTGIANIDSFPVTFTLSIPRIKDTEIKFAIE